MCIKNSQKWSHKVLQVGWKYFPFTEVELKIPSIEKALKGIRILQLSDLHLTSKVDVSYLNTLVNKINDLEVDLVVFTGDIIQTSAKKLSKQLKTFSALKAPSYYVTGNHDMVYGPNALKKELEQNGVKCLDNTVETIHINNTPLQLVGLSDRYSFARGITRDVKKLFESLDASKSTVLLAHQPKDIKHTSKYKIDLQLSGHTHGGQIFPFDKITKIFQPYFAGHYTYNDTHLYVTRGLGYWGLSVRYKVPAEIPIISIH